MKNYLVLLLYEIITCIFLHESCIHNYVVTFICTYTYIVTMQFLLLEIASPPVECTKLFVA